MSYALIQTLPSEETLRNALPLSPVFLKKIQHDRHDIKNILSGKDSRLLLIIGPCSAWPSEAVLEYADRLVNFSEKNPLFTQKIKLIMRVYSQKPRTTHGWAGPLTQPNPCTTPNFMDGLFYTRNMMLKVIEKGLPIADEALFIGPTHYFLDLLSWVAIGARSTENPEHRVFASLLDCAVGLKNPTHGSLIIGINSVLAAQQSHHTMFSHQEIKTDGNPYAHLVLRGSDQQPNYTIDFLHTAQNAIEKKSLKNPAILIDASHDNCIIHGKKNYLQQINVIFETLDNLKRHPELKKIIKGFMIESFLQPGKQTIDAHFPYKIQHNGLSITDPCLGWEQTEDLLNRLIQL